MTDIPLTRIISTNGDSEDHQCKNQRTCRERIPGDDKERAVIKQTVTTNYKNDCLTCHEPARGPDLLYFQGYPLLHKPAPNSGHDVECGSPCHCPKNGGYSLILAFDAPAPLVVAARR